MFFLMLCIHLCVCDIWKCAWKSPHFKLEIDIRCLVLLPSTLFIYLLLLCCYCCCFKIIFRTSFHFLSSHQSWHITLFIYTGFFYTNWYSRHICIYMFNLFSHIMLLCECFKAWLTFITGQSIGMLFSEHDHVSYSQYSSVANNSLYRVEASCSLL